jgi:hypothetical protein
MPLKKVYSALYQVDLNFPTKARAVDSSSAPASLQFSSTRTLLESRWGNPEPVSPQYPINH